MKRCWPLVILGLLLFPGLVQAESITLNNYYYVHTNTPGTHVLKDKYNNTLLYGDYGDDDAYIKQINARTYMGMQNSKVVITTREGYVFDNVTFPLALGDKKSKSVKIELIKEGYQETMVELSWITADDIGGGVTVQYTFNGSLPTKWGDLGTGTPTPTTTPGATPKPTATPTATPTPTPSPTPQVGNLMAYRQGNQIIWPSEPSNTSRIDVYKNGTKVASVPKGALYYNFPDPEDVDGTYELRAVSTQGNVIAKTELILNGGNTSTPQPTTNPDPSPTDPGGGTGEGTEDSCSAGCQNIIDQLECPRWDEYMGEWADMIQSVIPPPPDWDMVADKIGAATINHLANYMGDVPSPPSREEIKNETQADLPGLDTSVETNDLVPKVPDDYNGGKIIFDLNKDAPTIDVKDESQPFIIEDPLTNMPHDDVGVKVIPGDERNSTGGFKNPDKVDTGDPAPTPGKIIFEFPNQSPPVPNATPGAPPIPSSQPDAPPIPGSEAGTPPTPGTVDSIIPIPKGGE